MNIEGRSCDSIAIYADPNGRVRVDGKFLRLDRYKFYVKGFSYGPFSMNSDGDPLPEPRQFVADLKCMRSLGANTLRLYFVPSPKALDHLLENGLRVLVDVPWEKHRCFFEDWAARESARESVVAAARLAANHPAILAVSVVNEIPSDVVRFYGHERIERFLEELGDSVKQVAPECLVTFANFPTTEFLQPAGFDICSFNIYLHDLGQLGSYLDRLQHIAGDQPLLLSEFGMDSYREGEARQAALLSDHIRTVFDHGLTGSIVFSYTDDWFTGGAAVSDWGFGVTAADRDEKPSARALCRAWQQVPFAKQADLPCVSVVVCAYNAGRTLRECLDALTRINYPDYEVVLVDDGSTDNTPSIAAEYPQTIYLRQSNHGLSHARNVGAQAAKGDIIAYTDADCAPDEDWLRCLVQAMRDQSVQAIGGPNITPRSDGWAAHCVAASPGNPSHVMFDDQFAEHVPGCNMAFRRESLETLGGFDPQFRVAGDDVDMCWRLLDNGSKIGYAPGAFVWHHRRETVKAYLKQQIGYGRAEALLYFMHPHRFSLSGRCSWHGRIYGSGAAGLPLLRERIYYGTFGLAPFQTIYRHNEYGLWACVTWLEWHLVALFFLALSFLFWPLAVISAIMWLGTGVATVNAARHARLPNGAPWWCRPLIAVLHVVQPTVREWHRTTYDLRMWRPRLSSVYSTVSHVPKIISSRIRDLYWTSDQGVGRESLLQNIVEEAKRLKWLGVFNNAWVTWDVKLVGDLWHTLHVGTVTEKLGNNKCFTRARIIAQPTLINRVVSAGALAWTVAALFSMQPVALSLALLASAAALLQNINSRRRCLRAAVSLVAHAGKRAGLESTNFLGDAVDGSAESKKHMEPASTAGQPRIPELTSRP
jgi:GT2 family glycosyltransferase